jgi:hypothetical protein
MNRVAAEGNESAAGPADAINEAAARRRPPPRIQRRGSCMGSMLLSAQATEAEVDDIINGLQHSHPEALYGTRHTSQVVNNASHASELKAQKEQIIEKLYDNEENQVEAIEPRRTSLRKGSLKGAVRRVMMMNRLANVNKQNMQAWRRAQGRQEQQAWYKKTFCQDSRLVCALNSLVTAASISDLCILMVEATGVLGCSPDCEQRGGPFGSESPFTAEGELTRGYLGRSFLGVRTCLGLLSDLIYLLYFAVRMRTSPFRRRFAAPHLTKRDICLHYMRSPAFFWDLLGCLPFYWLGTKSPFCRINRVVNVLRIGFRNSEIQKWLQPILGVQVRGQHLDLVKYLLALLVYVHLMTCLTMLIAWHTLLDSSSRENGDNPADADEVRRWLDIADTAKADMNKWGFFYLHCSLWVFSNVSGLGGNWSPHTLVTSGWTYVNQVIGIFIYMYLFGKIVNILHNFDLAAAEFESLRNKVDTFLRIREIPEEMQTRVRGYLDELWQLKHGVDEQETLALLPTFLRHDLAWFLNQQFLEKLPMFFGADTSMILEVNRHLTMTVAPENEFVCRCGELAYEMHFVLTGKISICRDRNKDGKGGAGSNSLPDARTGSGSSHDTEPDLLGSGSTGDMELDLFEGSIVGEVAGGC